MIHAAVAATTPVPAATAVPGGDETLRYYRLHGSPRIYWSDYEPTRLAEVAERLRGATVAGGERWCIFDNTTLGAATGNALALVRLLEE